MAALATAVAGGAILPVATDFAPLPDWGDSDERAGRLELAFAPIRPTRAQLILMDYGFSPDVAAAGAETACLFLADVGRGTVDDDAPALVVERSRWRADRGEGWEPLRQGIWYLDMEKRAANPSAPVVLGWNLLPDDLVLGAGDQFTGFVAFGYSPGALFELQVRWSVGPVEHTAVVSGLRCAERDRVPPVS
jgi:hypothetical protein